MSKSKNKRIGITLGDPNGIGPEVVAKALRQKHRIPFSRLVVIGDQYVYRKYDRQIPVEIVNVQSLPSQNFKPGQQSPPGAQASLSYLNKAIELLKNGTITGLVTGPLCKETICDLGVSFHGHTEYLAEAFGVSRFAMMFVADRLKTVVVTRHIPLKDVPAAINAENIFVAIELTAQSLRLYFKIDDPVIAVCGLNPHAGEGGTIGGEDQEKILPAVKKAQAIGIRAIGPLPADTLFIAQNLKKFDAVIAMYHDQGLIPVKTLYFKNLVNFTAGLPFIRTSPVHGTAFDIAGRNKADCSSMTEAIKLAARLST